VIEVAVDRSLDLVRAGASSFGFAGFFSSPEEAIGGIGSPAASSGPVPNVAEIDRLTGTWLRTFP
jgi:hypothetical protein